MQRRPTGSATAPARGRLAVAMAATASRRERGSSTTSAPPAASRARTSGAARSGADDHDAVTARRLPRRSRRRSRGRARPGSARDRLPSSASTTRRYSPRAARTASTGTSASATRSMRWPPSTTSATTAARLQPVTMRVTPCSATIAAIADASDGSTRTTDDGLAPEREHLPLRRLRPRACGLELRSRRRRDRTDEDGAALGHRHPRGELDDRRVVHDVDWHEDRLGEPLALHSRRIDPPGGAPRDDARRRGR